MTVTNVQGEKTGSCERDKGKKGKGGDLEKFKIGGKGFYMYVSNGLERKTV